MWQGHEEKAVAGERRRRRGRETAVAGAGPVVLAGWEGESPSPRDSGLSAAVEPPLSVPWLRHVPQGTP